MCLARPRATARTGGKKVPAHRVSTAPYTIWTVILAVECPSFLLICHSCEISTITEDKTPLLFIKDKTPVHV